MLNKVSNKVLELGGSLSFSASPPLLLSGDDDGDDGDAGGDDDDIYIMVKCLSVCI